MSNPRYVPVSPDDTMWFYETRVGEALPATGQTEAWFDSHIFRPPSQPPRCGRPDNLQIFKAKYDSGNNRTQFAGVCGTSLVLASGFTGGPPLEFIEREAARRVELASSTYAAPESFLDQSRDLTGFWDTFEDDLSAQNGRGGDIEFLFFAEEKQMYVHLELGGDPEFSAAFFVALQSRAEFLQWLTTQARISRTLFQIMPDNRKMPLTNISVSDIVFKDVDDPQFDTGIFAMAPACPDGCVFTACSLMAGTLTSFDPNNQDVEVGLEVVGIKGYCDRIDGTGPCF